MYLGGTLHTVEVTLGTVSVGSHSVETQPIPDLEVLGKGNVLGNDVSAVAGHPEQGGILKIAMIDGLVDIILVHGGVKLICRLLIFETDSIH